MYDFLALGHRNFRRLFVGTVVLSALTMNVACDVFTGPESAVVGKIADASADVIDAPTTIVAGTSFVVTVTTVAADGCWDAAGADVRYSGTPTSIATIVPYDRYARRSGTTAFCPPFVSRERSPSDSPRLARQ